MKKSLKIRRYTFPVLIEKDESGYFIGTIPSLKSCHTQAKTLSTLYKRLDEVAKLCLEVEEKDLKTRIPQNEFIGIQMLEFSK